MANAPANTPPKRVEAHPAVPWRSDKARVSREQVERFIDLYGRSLGNVTLACEGATPHLKPKFWRDQLRFSPVLKSLCDDAYRDGVDRLEHLIFETATILKRQPVISGGKIVKTELPDGSTQEVWIERPADAKLLLRLAEAHLERYQPKPQEIHVQHDVNVKQGPGFDPRTTILITPEQCAHFTDEQMAALKVVTNALRTGESMKATALKLQNMKTLGQLQQKDGAFIDADFAEIADESAPGIAAQEISDEEWLARELGQ